MTRKETVAAVVVAAGRGVRMGLAVRKQYLEIAGAPMLCRTLSAFARHPEVDTLVLVVPQEDFGYIEETVLPHVLPRRPVALAPGGAERQDSVRSGLSRLPAGCEVVLIHDGVRPFVTGALISACIAAAREHGAATAAVPASDTIKFADPDGFVEKTLDRGRVWLTQTPQAFRLPLILSAHEKAAESGLRATDDAALAEAAGLRVKLVDGGRENLKITTPGDLALARALLAREETTGA